MRVCTAQGLVRRGKSWTHGEKESMGGVGLFEWNAQQEQMAQAEAQQVAETQRQIKMEAGNLRG